MSGTLRVRAFAKINLDLRILGTRADGHHELSTIFQTIALHDTLTFTAAGDGIEIVCSSPGVPLDPTNLVWRAADALWRSAGRSGRTPGVRVELVKGIPSEAGLGGGSADAAATLAALDVLWSLGSPAPRLHELAAGLGADVAFFLTGGAALGRGRGEVLTPLPDLPAWPVVLAVPAPGVSTAAAYGWYDADGVPASPEGSAPRDAGDWPRRLAGFGNDLEGPVGRRRPEIGRLAASMRALGADLAAMSGSGSAVFGLFRTAAAAAATGAALAPSGVAIHATRLLPGAEYRAAHAPAPA
jgi:4-diphosphocytidyl-2-C-methyl-D-erythritol kinase